MTDSPPLEYLARAYFHQDWADDAPDALGVIDLFSQENPRADVLAARDSAAELLAADLSDDELAARFESLGFNYVPQLDGMTEREWLQAVVDRLSTLSNGAG